jgi:hypothetical protein
MARLVRGDTHQMYLSLPYVPGGTPVVAVFYT